MNTFKERAMLFNAGGITAKVMRGYALLELSRLQMEWCSKGADLATVERKMSCVRGYL